MTSHIATDITETSMSTNSSEYTNLYELKVTKLKENQLLDFLYVAVDNLTHVWIGMDRCLT